MLNSASLENGKIEINKEPLDVHEIISDVVNKFHLQIENVNGKIITNFNADSNSIFADKFHLSVIFNNIIDNAIKYNSHEPVIIIDTENRDGKIIVNISDNGIGIKKSDLKNIFDSFYRVPTGNIHDVKGSGMGLYYVKNLTNANGGNISVSSTLGKGTKFKLEFECEQSK